MDISAQEGLNPWAFGNKPLFTLLSHKHLSFHQLRTFVDFLKGQGVSIPPRILQVLSENYFYDQVVASYPIDAHLEMADIEVEDEHNFVLEGAVVHNSQGSTFQHTFIDLGDIYSNRNQGQADKCYYVALTRAARRAYVIS